MTLLESLVALVILGLAAVGFLELFQRVSATTRDTVAWTRAVQVAETTMERAIIGEQVQATDTLDGLRREVRVRPWRAGLREISVTVHLPPPGVAQVEIRRLVAAR
jgi:type II secretory pathway pseudopilin PulG